jgi:hypothetical protein
MNLSSALDIEKLLRLRDQPCVSIYIPTRSSGTDAKEPSIRLKNAVQKCQEQLGRRGVKRQVISDILAPVRALGTETLSWGQPGRELAIFSRRDFFQYHRLQINHTQQISVAYRPYIKPLVPLLMFSGKFYILTLSLHQIKLYEATREGMQEKLLKNCPRSIEDLLQYEQVEEHIQAHTMPRGKSAGSSAIFHGHGNIADKTKHKKDIAEYLNTVDKGLKELLSTERSPLVLAGVDYIRAEYAKLSSYPNVLSEGIDGNPEQFKESKLHQAAWHIIEPLLDRQLRADVEKFGDFSAYGRTSTDLREILPAAYQGRVDTLLVDAARCTWGGFDPGSNQIHVHEEPEANDEDLLNLAIIYVLAGRGKVYMPSKQRMPEGAVQAAVFRY